MHDTERRALGRAAALLLLVSAVRFAVVHPGGPIDAPPPSVLDSLTQASGVAHSDAERRARPLGDGERLDVNAAPPAELDRLPGVGPSLAAAIVAERDAGGGFRRVEELDRVRGIGPALLERLRPHVDVGPVPPGSARTRPPSAAVRRVDLNRAGLEELQTLPGVGPALAERIVARRQKRLFTTVDDLLEVRGIGPATLERLREGVVVSASR
jgi:competence ComEA-like helix-hairpin-helix protein